MTKPKTGVNRIAPEAHLVAAEVFIQNAPMRAPFEIGFPPSVRGSTALCPKQMKQLKIVHNSQRK